jgi:hypothetical protein
MWLKIGKGWAVVNMDWFHGSVRMAWQYGNQVTGYKVLPCILRIT